MWRNKLIKKSNKSYEDIHYSCTIRFLDDSEPLSVTFQKDTKGQWLLDHVCRELNLEEKDYFGLRFVDADKQRHWLDPTKLVYKQLKHVLPVVLCFRVKFYVPEPMKLKEEITRYFLFLQLRRDLHHGRLLCSPTDANLLAGYIIQSEVGDYDPQDHPAGYVAEFKMLPKQTQKQEEKIAELHKTLVGQVPSESEANFLKKASQLDTYGVDPHPVKDHQGNQMYLGVTHLGIVTFQGNKRAHLFKWPQITKIAFEGKMFIVHVTISEGEELQPNVVKKKKKHACGFKCPTFTACKHLWKCAVEQQYFFTLSTSAEAPKVTSGGGLFSRGSKFRFSGRCQKDVYSASQGITRDEPHFARSSSNPSFVRNYNQSKSASLPSRLRQSLDHYNSGEALLEDNHITLLMDSPPSSPPDDSYLGTQLESSIPEEETPVEIADGALYDPTLSPTSDNLHDDLHPIPANGSAVYDAPPPVLSDLDTQIAELQSELDKCRNDSREEPEGAQIEPDIVLATQQAAPPDVVTETAADGPAPAAEVAVPDLEQQVQRSLSCCRALTITILFVFSILLITAIVVLESDMDFPGITTIRSLPEVQDFRDQQYNPFKSTVTQKMNGLFK